MMRGIVLLVVLFLSIVSLGEGRKFHALLTGSAERPTPVETLHSGKAILLYNEKTQELSVTIHHTLAALNAAFLHGPADKEHNAGVLYAFNIAPGQPNDPIIQTFVLDEETEKILMNGEMYINLFTQNYPGGELRGQVVGEAFCTVEDTLPLLTTMFASLGNDCNRWFSLFGFTAQYYHQHDGYKTYNQLLANCQNYASFCPGGDDPCAFRQQGLHQVYRASENECHILAPYLWSEIPANHLVPNNLEPHTGWEFIIAEPDPTSFVGYNITHFAEIETSYAVAYNRGNPKDTSVYSWTTDLLKGTASNGECNAPVAGTITNYFIENGGRQQQESVVLSTGGLCHVAVPYAEERNGFLNSGIVVMILDPVNSTSYDFQMTTTFPIDFRQ